MATIIRPKTRPAIVELPPNDHLPSPIDCKTKPHRRKAARIANGIGALLAGSLLFPGSGNLMTPTVRHGRVPAPLLDNTLNVMTANVHGWRSPVGKSNLDDFLGVLRATNPDAVCVQEGYSERDNALDEITREGYNVAFAPTIVLPGLGPRGNMVISKHEITIERVESLSPSNGLGEERNAVTVMIGGMKGVRLRNTHLSTGDKQPEAQLHILGAEDYGEVIDCGDYNQTTSEVAASSLGKRFNISAEAVFPSTFPAWEPTRSIDQIMTNCPAGSVKLEEIGSDHLAVMRRINLGEC
jgi:endonuclease/exonuclease/phosphatase family metal-dependent hydrolase